MKKILLSIASVVCLSLVTKAQITIDQVLITNGTSNDLTLNAVAGINWGCQMRTSVGPLSLPIGATQTFDATLGNNELLLPSITGTGGVLAIIHGLFLRIHDVGQTHHYINQLSFDNGMCPQLFPGSFTNTLGISFSYTISGNTLEIEIQ
jgi:hypothetical protein